MFGRRALVVSTLAVVVLGGGVAPAATREGSRSQAIRPPKLLPGLVRVHVCHPGVKGSELDSLD